MPGTGIQEKMLQVQLEEDGGGRARQLDESRGLWPTMLHQERQDINQ